MKWLSAVQHLASSSDPTNPTAASGMEYFDSTNKALKVHDGTSWLYANEFVIPFTIQGTLAVSVTGRKQRLYNRSGSPWLVVGANLFINTAPVGSSATIQVNKNGSSSFTISCATTVQNNNSSPNVTVADGDYIDVDVTAIGSTTAGSDATLTLSVVS